jgi:hypothetical protein
MIAAEVEVKGERKAAINEGFRLIAAYIFGANEPNAKIAMTAPVQQQGMLAELSAILPCNSNRMAPLLGKSGVVDNPGLDRTLAFNHRHHHFAYLGTAAS